MTDISKSDIIIDPSQTNTTRFLVPSFGLSLENLKKIGFINAYLADVHRDKSNCEDIPIYLLFKREDISTISLSRVIKVWEEEGWLIETYEYPEDYQVVVLRLSEDFRKDFFKFIKGRYSKFSLLLKDKLPKTIPVILEGGKKGTRESIQFLVTSKRVKLKEYWEEKTGLDFEGLEYWSKPKIEDETLDIYKI